MNIVKLDAAIAWAEENPDRFNQQDPYAKRPHGETMCMAGIVCMLDGWKPDWEERTMHDGADLLCYSVRRDGEVRGAMDLARSILEATRAQYTGLFLTSHDLRTIKILRDMYAGEDAW